MIYRDGAGFAPHYQPVMPRSGITTRQQGQAGSHQRQPLTDSQRTQADWFVMAGREATGILWSVYLYLKDTDALSAMLVSGIRDSLIDHLIDDEKTMYLLGKKRDRIFNHDGA